MIFELTYYGRFNPEWVESLPWERFRYLHKKLADTKKEEKKQEDDAMRVAKGKPHSRVSRRG
jgi:hypothetical protein